MIIVIDFVTLALMLVPGIAISKAINCMQLQLIATLGLAITISNFKN